MSDRKTQLRALWDACEGHVWEESGIVIDTSPEQDTFFCRKCGAATHDPKTGAYCFTKHFGQGKATRS